ncbi:type 1 glutamine amidotransferase [uncultured Methylobacterium sp.]|jgi:GMP synthase (glutamine-hydrolysing)|uniref:type 1 glutamine amidotransferase n=1 Tax=uncultured Methylobacterium sp. TaxID=157278 RepID=UPI00262FB2F8|nr:type 1 glutamine amidotransferase [uncultured Methylobacterium sp.]
MSNLPETSPVLHLLIADGNDRAGRARHRAARGRSSAESFAAVIADLAPGAACHCFAPADAEADLPPGGLDAYDGLIFTGSTLQIREASPEVMRQLALMRAALEAGLPVLGSCWGLHVAVAVAGGSVGESPRGPEYGLARGLALTAAGAAHPFLAGRPARYDAPAIHCDAVTALPPDAAVLAANDRLDVQALALRFGAGTFWGTQYHPELDLDDLAALLRLSADEVVAAGLQPDGAAVEAEADDLDALARGPDPARAERRGLGREVLDATRRRREIGNFLGGLGRAGRG